MERLSVINIDKYAWFEKNFCSSYNAINPYLRLEDLCRESDCREECLYGLTVLLVCPGAQTEDGGALPHPDRCVGHGARHPPPGPELLAQLLCGDTGRYTHQ